MRLTCWTEYRRINNWSSRVETYGDHEWEKCLCRFMLAKLCTHSARIKMPLTQCFLNIFTQFYKKKKILGDHFLTWMRRCVLVSLIEPENAVAGGKVISMGWRWFLLNIIPVSVTCIPRPFHGKRVYFRRISTDCRPMCLIDRNSNESW